MHKDKLTNQARKTAFSRVMAPVIIETRRGFINELIPTLMPFVENLRDRKKVFGRTIALPFKPLRRLDPFNMVGAVLPREVIFSLAEESRVVKIYNDRLMYAFSSFPVVSQDGIYQMTRGRKTKDVTTTAFTRELMGLQKGSRFLGNGINVSVLDTGATRVHEQRPNVVDFDTVTQQHRDENGHGTWCVTCIGGGVGYDEFLTRQNERDAPVFGMAPNCNITAIKCLGWYIGTGSTSGIIEAMGIGANTSKILSMSLGGSIEGEQPQDDPFYPVIDELVNKGIIPVIAAGNEGPEKETIGSPGCHEGVLTIGAYNPLTGNMADFSSRGPTPWNSIKPDCVAPGVNIVSGCVGSIARQEGRPDRYAALSGTSMATPHVSGIIACMEQAHNELLGKSLSVIEIKEMLKQLGTDKNNAIGWGKIDWGMYINWLSTEYGVHY